MVSFDSFYHDLDDEEPLEVEDEDALVWEIKETKCSIKVLNETKLMVIDLAW